MTRSGLGASVKDLARLLRRTEARALLVVLAVAGAVWAFLTVAGEVGEGETLALDRRMLLMLRTPGDPATPIGSRAFQEAMRDVTALGGFSVLTLVTVVAALAFALHRKLRHALVLIATVLTASFASESLKALYHRPRPDLFAPGVFVYSGSFPSGHSMLSAATYLTLAMLIASLETVRARKIAPFAVAVLLMLSVGFSRVYLAAHWPSDVLAGWCAGAAWALAAWAALVRLSSKGGG